jgi:hypothetical protein
MNSFDEKYPGISEVLIYKQSHFPKFKAFRTTNYICFDLMLRLPTKGWVWDKWLVHIPTTETFRHCTWYDWKTKKLLGIIKEIKIKKIKKN